MFSQVVTMATINYITKCNILHNLGFRLKPGRNLRGFAYLFTKSLKFKPERTLTLADAMCLKKCAL